MYACGARTIPKSSLLVSAGHSVSPSGEPVWSAVSSPGIPLALAVGSGQPILVVGRWGAVAVEPENAGRRLLNTQHRDPTSLEVTLESVAVSGAHAMQWNHGTLIPGPAAALGACNLRHEELDKRIVPEAVRCCQAY